MHGIEIRHAEDDMGSIAQILGFGVYDSDAYGPVDSVPRSFTLRGNGGHTSEM